MKIPKIKIGDRLISSNSEPYVIAELSANHNGSLEMALRLIEAAKKAGADAVKLQTYTPDTITINSNNEEFLIKAGLWAGKTLYELYQEAHMPWDWHEKLFKYAEELNITIFSSPFDCTAVDLLSGLNAPAYKIASFEIVDLPLIRYAASKGKPLIISSGMASPMEVQEALLAAREAGCTEIALLHCVSGYPAPAKDYNLKMIEEKARKYGVVMGLSDHTLGNVTAIASVGMGASIIEKHFTLDRKNGGPDNSFSLEPKELENLCRDVKIAWEAVGGITNEIKKSEEGNIQYRRSIYFIRDMVAGQRITQDDIKSVRPGNGILPKYYEVLLGKKVTKKITKNTPVLKEDIEW